jgi:hypothetical protein
VSGEVPVTVGETNMSRIGSISFEFPDYGPLDFQPPIGWKSEHWHNNACPCWVSSADDNGLSMVLWAEHAKPEMRELQSPRFELCLRESDGTYEPMGWGLQTEDYSEILAAIARPPKHDAATLARYFGEVIRQWLTPEEMASVIARNAVETDPHVCHSHDFCDANMAMLRAMAPEQFAPDDEEQTARINAAWDIARKGEFK